MSGWTSALDTARKSLGRGLTFVGAGAVLSSVAVLAARFQASRADKQLPSEFVLELPLDRLHVVDAVNPSPLALLRGDINQVELPKIVAALKRAAADERCRGVVTYVGPREHLGGLATVQELRDALSRFRDAARPRGALTAAFAATYGEAGTPGMAQYLLASACDRVYMQPSGMLGLSGLESRGFFVRRLLDRIGAEVHFFAREEYKSAANTLRYSGFTDPQRENLTSLLGDMAEQMLGSMATARGLGGGAGPGSALREAVEAAPLLPTPAIQAKLLDGTKYKDEVQSLFRISDNGLKEEKDKAGAKHRRRKDDVRMPRVSIEKYIALWELQQAAERSAGAPAGWLSGTPFESMWLVATGRAKDAAAAPMDPTAAPEPGAGAWGSKAKQRVAVVTLSGTIVQGPVPPGQQQQVIDATRLTGQLCALLEDPHVAAVVLRVNSPGGSALASDSIHHELERIRAAGKPIVVSMGDVAASGGYYIACAADRVLAQPGSLTGSIGVVVGKVNAARALQDLGVDTQEVQVGRNASLLSPFTGLSPEQEGQVEAMMDAVYDDFLAKVSRSRGRPVHEVRQLAKGRVYTGKQAYDVGLVDELGGLDRAVDVARQLARLPADAPAVDHPPRRVPLLLQLLKRSGMVPQNGEGGAPGAAAGAGQLGGLVALAGAVLGGAAGAAGGGTGAGVEALAGLALAAGAGGREVGQVLRQLGVVASQLDGEPKLLSAEAALLAGQV